MRITVFSAACEALFTSDRIQLHHFAWFSAGWDNCTPDSVPASPSGVSRFDGVINMKTPDFSLFSLPLKISLHFAVLPECRSCPCLFSGVFRHWHAFPCFQALGVMALLPLPRVSHSDGHVVFKVQRAKRQQKSRHKTDQPCLRFFWKVMLVGYVTAESQNVQPRRARTNM